MEPSSGDGQHPTRHLHIVKILEVMARHDAGTGK